MLSLDKCDDACGFLAAIGGAVCYGSYGVPIKATSSIDAHPLVVQSYKTFVVFIASLVVVLAEERPRWTSYGLISGLLWVSGGTLGIMAIRNAGIATAVGTWSSIMVIINFVWGILVFHEPVHSLTTTFGAFFLLGIGLVGMITFSSPGQKNDSGDEVTKTDMEGYENVIDKEANQVNDSGLTSRLKRGTSDVKESAPNPSTSILTGDRKSDEYFGEKDSRSKISIAKQVFGRSPTQWEIGVIYAALTGVLAGSSLVPLHYAKLEGFSHFSYYISLTSGALLANIILWLILLLSHLHNTHEEISVGQAFKSMPQWHFRQLWLKLAVAGLLSNGGMFGGILATSSLGQAIGNSLIQLKIFISGLWGICYFKETKDRKSTIYWLLSATMCVVSILCLSYERGKTIQDVEEERKIE